MDRLVDPAGLTCASASGARAHERGRSICGIAGFSLSPSDTINRKRAARALLLNIESRGKDATGIAWRSKVDRDLRVVKRDIPASKFIKSCLHPERNAETLILHTRAATQGSPFNRANNHPISTGGIVGVHNGVIWNDDTIFRTMDLEDARIGQVDSEAVFAAIAYGTEVAKQGDTNRLRLGFDLKDCLEQIEGSAAIAWMDRWDELEYLHLARLSSSPLCIGQNEHGSLFFASTKSALDDMCKAADTTLDFYEEAKEGTYYKVRNGRIEECWDFKPNPGYYGGSRRGTFMADWESMSWRDDKYEWDKPYSSNTSGKTSTIIGPTPEEWHEDAVAELRRLREAEGRGTGGKVYEVINGVLHELDDSGEFVKSEFVVEPTLAEEFEDITSDDKVYGPDDFKWVDPSLLQPEMPGIHVSPSDYLSEYKARENAIEEFVVLLATEDPSLEPGDAWDFALDKQASARPGKWVKTEFMGQKGVVGQIAYLPQTFPEGKYVLMLYINNGDRKMAHERVFVLRTCDEFSTLMGGELTSALRESAKREVETLGTAPALEAPQLTLVDAIDREVIETADV